MEDFFDKHYLHNKNILLKLKSSCLFYKIVVQETCPTVEVGLRNLLKSFGDELQLGATFSSRGQQKLNIEGDLSRVIPGFKFSSKLAFDTCAHDMYQNTVFKYAFNKQWKTKTWVDIADGDVEVATSLKRRISENLAIKAHALYVKSTNTVDRFTLTTKYNPYEHINTEIVYENPIQSSSNSLKSFDIPLGSLRLRLLFQADKYTKLGLDYRLNMDTSKTRLILGIQNKSIKNTELKAKIDQSGELEAVVRYKWLKNLKLIASSKINLQDMKSQTQADYGLGLEYNF